MKSKLLVVFLILSLMSLWGGMALAKTTITAWWTVRKPVMDYSREEVLKYELEHPDIKVELVGMPGDVILQKLPGAVRTKTGPDICFIDENLVKPMYLGGILQ
ncbi:carbohydrate ABC transporter substrate-binding protein, partial [Patescibacteria group bacterium]|nr:carbohydrate ABC transporter substrate-binding protein [Patescibacteria group bacterium]